MTLATGAGADGTRGVAALSPTVRRVTVVTPRARVDVALPLESTIAELIPQLVRLSAAETTTPVAAPGWALRRLGGAGLEPGLTVAGAGLRDGDLVYLSPRERTAVPLLFDDVVDAIASAADETPDRWRPWVARRVATTAAAVGFLGAALLLITAASSPAVAAASAGALALLLVLAAAALSRSYGDAVAGLGCALAAVPTAYLAGASSLPDHPLWPVTAPSFALGAAAVTVVAVLAAVGLADRPDLFTGIAVAGAGGAITAAVTSLGPVRPTSVAAVTVAVCTAVAAFAPVLSVRLSRLPLPRVPTDVDDFRGEQDPTVGADVVDRTVLADRMLTGLLAALGLLVAGSCLVLVRDTSRWSWTLAGVAGVVWAARSRSYAGWRQRAVLVLTGVAVLAGLGARLAVSGERSVQLGAALAVVVAAAGCIAFAVRVARGVRSPYSIRLTDAVEFVGVIAILPVVGAVVGIYRTLRGLGG